MISQLFIYILFSEKFGTQKMTELILPRYLTHGIIYRYLDIVRKKKQGEIICRYIYMYSS